MDPESFKREAEIMTRFKHRNLVRIYGVCISQQPLYIITEFCQNGSLLSYLKGNEGQTCSMKQLIKMIADIAAGMNYLEGEKIVHRDLAARNVLITSEWRCKVADFGLSRLIEGDVYQSVRGTKLPIKWTAPEGINESRFTTKSDVWSFGILCYEITTRGEPPYKGISSGQIMKLLQDNYRLPKPNECPMWLYLVMYKCWYLNPNQRYSFRHIRKLIKKYGKQS